MTTPEIAPTERLLPCPFCKAGEHRIDVQWLNRAPSMGGNPNSIVSATVIHWCEKQDGQPQSIIKITGRDEESAIRLWNTRPQREAEGVEGLLAQVPKGSCKLEYMAFNGKTRSWQFEFFGDKELKLRHGQGNTPAEAIKAALQRKEGK